jgi:hypothetical protein
VSLNPFLRVFISKRFFLIPNLRLFPDLMHVDFLPTAIDVAPSLEQVAPALTTEIALSGTRNLAAATSATRSFLMENG